MSVMPFATGTHQVDSLAVDTQQIENLYVQLSQTGKSIASLHTRPGLREIYDFGVNPVRGLILTGDSASRFTRYIVTYSSLLRQIPGQPPEFLGAIETTEGPVNMAYNGHQVLLTDGVNGYLYDENTTTYVKLDNPTHGWTLVRPQFVTYLSTYFVVLDAEDGSYNISDNNNGLQWSAADKAFAETDPDGLVQLTSNHGELWLFGTRTTEVHYNSGAADFPFAAKLSATLQWGTPAPYSVASFDNTLAFLGQSDRGGLRIFRINGYQPQRISNAAVEHRLDEYETVNDAVAFGYDYGDHAFYSITFPTEGEAWLYDAHSGQWTIVTSSDGGRYIAQYATGREGATLVTDYSNGKLYEIEDCECDGGLPIYVRARAQTINNNEQEMAHASFQVVCEHGTAAQTANPQAMLRWSNDNGLTWSNSYWRPIGRVGQYGARCRWNRLGWVRNRTYEIKITDPVPKVIVGMVVNQQ